MDSMALTTPIIIEVKGDQYRRSLKHEFGTFTITNRLIKKEDEIGFVNKLTDNLLVITWMQGANYVRYYYEK